MKTFAIGDIHGRYDHLVRLLRRVKKAGGLNFKAGDVLVQLGDRCDRGKDTFRVNNLFFKLQKRYPDQVICLKGNHEDMMLGAATFTGDKDLFLMNGGGSTVKSYQKRTKNYRGVDKCGNLYFDLIKTGHLDWLMRQPLFYETDKYFFSHAPIPKLSHR